MRTSTLWAPLAALLALAGCDSGSGGECGALVWSADNQPCDECMNSKCCHALAACDTDTPCGRLTTCVLACPGGDAGCTEACMNAEPTGAVRMDALFACYEDSCKRTAACETRVCDTSVVIDDAACGACLSASCCDTWKPCAADAACAACLTQEPKPDTCVDDALYHSAAACFLDACGTACAATICDSNLGTPSAACNACLGRADATGGCCEQTLACKADPGCYGCITGTNTAGCSDNGAWTTFNACLDAKCAAPCGT